MLRKEHPMSANTTHGQSTDLPQQTTGMSEEKSNLADTEPASEHNPAVNKKKYLPKIILAFQFLTDDKDGIEKVNRIKEKISW